ncbi:MAG: hypothetical protein JHC84_08265, partial [Solirubrobacteraceae bacterium]|nr:hypothetical protein [Solirubrobacteraceae bacterium]
CAIKTDGTPVCWGDNAFGQITVPDGTGTVTQITGGDFHTCAIKTDGTPTCWGNNASGQTTVPDGVGGVGFVTQITAGGFHTCAIKTDGTPVCWGNNSNGQTTIPGGTGTVTQITAGSSHTCAIKTDGTPTCWGSNDDGQSRATISGTPPAVIGGGAFSFAFTGGPRFVVSAGALPDGLSINEAGVISGTPTTQQTRTATITASPDEFPPSASTEVTITVDLTAPSTTDNVPAGFAAAAIPVTLTATDTGGAAGVQTTTFEKVAADGTIGATQTYNPASKPTLNNGEKIRYRSTDTAGNTEANKTSAAAKVDTTTPVVTFTAAPAASSSDRSPTVAFTASSAPATFACSLDGAPFAACTSPVTLGPLADGAHTFSVRATSQAGTTGPTATATFTIVPPLVPDPPVALGGGGGPTPPDVTPPTPVKPTLALARRAKGRSLLLDRGTVPVRVSCGPVACRMTITSALRLKGKTRVTLRRTVISLRAGQTRVIAIKTSASQRRTIRRLTGPRGGGGQARFTLSATGGGATKRATVTLNLRRLAIR